MEAKKMKIVGALVAVLLLVVFINVLWVSLGVSKTFFILAGVGVALILGVVVWIVIKYASSSSDDEASTTTTVPKQQPAALEGEELRLQLQYSFLRKVTGLPTRFRYEALEAATDKFRVLIGRGSSASVFKGVLDCGTPVAVKRVEDSDHSDRVFRSEVAAIGRSQHVNLVHLLGYCIVPRSRVRLLVYEFVDNGSLDAWIFPARGGGGGGGGSRCLPWALRCRAAVDVARALAYLHRDCRSRVLHLDVKPENILLDAGFRALVADFGLSKVMGRDESRVVTTTVRGTRGYLAPEWIVGSGASEKSDVFSYGIVLLEMVGGRRSIRLAPGEGKWSYLPRIAAEKVRQGRVMEMVDERLVGAAEGAEESEARKLVCVALWCIREETKLRPSMAQVVDMLQGRMEVEAPPPEGNMLILDLLNMEYMSSAAAGGRAAAGRPRQPDSPTLGASGYFCSTSILSGR
ncbi:putative receptor-like protein kinase [Iris pallida]|uniref:Receptor-like protein kinase n=1 Tax=Iris pallida TaxID=29817 RepID=A0AAX6F499_IRIPA|nr:putative receptor-like protein kinase [Iris pallida]